MVWFFVLIFITWDGLETRHLEGPYPSKAACEAGIVSAGQHIPARVERASASPCQRALPVNSSVLQEEEVPT